MGLILVTGSLELRSLGIQDAGKVINYYQDNLDFFRPWMPIFHSDFFTLKFQEERLKYEEMLRIAGHKITLYIFRQNDEDKVKILGNVSCSNIIRGPLQSGILAYKLAEKETGKGIMTTALSRFISYLFKVQKLHRIEANIIPRNMASIQVIERQGFTKEGFSKEYLNINGRWEDHFRFALINPDYTETV